MSRPRLVTILGIVILTVALGGCGVANDGEPRALSTDEIPAELQTPTLPSTTVPAADATRARVYLFDQDQNRLTSVPVPVTAPIEPDQVLKALLKGPWDTAPLTSSIPPELTLGRTTLKETSYRDENHVLRTCNLLTLPVSDELSTVQQDQQRIAVAQMVFTATQFEDVECVSFKVGGELKDVPTGAKSGTAKVVSRSDYEDIAPVGAGS